MDAVELGAAACAIVAFGVFAVLSVVLAVIDARTHRLPDRFVLPCAVAGLPLVASAFLAGAPARIVPVLGGGAALFAFYLALGMMRPGAMGGGDVKLAAVIGAFLGWFGWEAVLLGAVAGFVLGGLQGVVLLALRRARATTALPFGPAMLAGAWLVIIAHAVAGG